MQSVAGVGLLLVPIHAMNYYFLNALTGEHGMQSVAGVGLLLVPIHAMNYYFLNAVGQNMRS